VARVRHGAYDHFDAKTHTSPADTASYEWLCSACAMQEALTLCSANHRDLVGMAESVGVALQQVGAWVWVLQAASCLQGKCSSDPLLACS